MTSHACPFTPGQLLALGAIASTSKAPGGPRLANLCFEHAREHPVEHNDTEDQEGPRT